MGPNQGEQPIAAVLVEMGGVLLNEVTVDRILELVTELTERTVHSADAVSVTLRRHGDDFTPTATRDVARELDEVQYQAESGPCLDALEQQKMVTSVFADEGRWPKFTAAAAGKNIGSVLSMPLAAGDRSLGALNIYSRAGSAFDDTEVATASLLAQQASVVLANATAYTDATTVNEQLATALETRDLIGQAKGILMAREGCDADAAFDILRRASQRLNRKLRDVAADLVASVNPPGA